FAGTRSDVVPWVRTADGVVYDGDDQVRQVRIGTDARVADGHSGLEVFGSARSGNGTFVTGIDVGNSGTASIGQGALAGPFVPDDYRIEIVAGAAGPDYRVLDGGGAVVASGSYESGGAIEFAGVRVVVSGAPEVGDAFSVTPSAPITMFEAVQGLIDAVALPDLGPAARTMRTGAQDAALADLDAALNRIVEVRAGIGSRLGFVATQKELGESLELNTEEAASSIRDVDLVEAIVALESQATSLEAAQRAFARIQGLNLFRFLG
ncbi:MAG: flagellin, partial [Pseudomonadales bacterium]|nr:flagellin [Pseudomonadales bacterium]